jgi:hypothetical protein
MYMAVLDSYSYCSRFVFPTGILERECTSSVDVYAVYSNTIHCSTRAKNICIWFIQNRYLFFSVRNLMAHCPAL